MFISHIISDEPRGGDLDKPDPRARPPEALKTVYKKYQTIKGSSLDSESDIFDASSGNYAGFEVRPAASAGTRMPDELVEVVARFLQDYAPADPSPAPSCYEHPHLPGLLVFSNLLSAPVQIALLDRLLHRDVSNPLHLNNLGLHYHVPNPTDSTSRPLSFFSPAASDLRLTPIDPSQHKPLTVKDLLDRKLRWITLGGQYDWTAKAYPSDVPPPFPPDIADLIHGVFPAIKPEAAILNLYNPGHTLSLHRDVSEECQRPLVSISLGCDGLFIAGLSSEDEGQTRMATMRLRSGDVVVMSGEARYAWHGVPKVLSGTCPDWLEDWPSIDGERGGEYKAWKGWMKGKRINLNVRQMRD
ncbi:hypothetical protein CAC42_512 [Sphaceloma murrayae]|uniref:mRNA N(6)-methyladenine demethylase n=1 Tax=Sphaceloma murrayae TaxID=2082308 RepID=A0A2K1R3Q5_9PEZI|nr:hypothetical protein CAC42_512 [Sphaceloma murrayae]